MSAKVGGIPGNCYVVAEPGRNFPMATGADVGLESLVGLDPTYLDGSIQTIPKAESGGLLLVCHARTGPSANEGPNDQGRGGNDGRGYEDVVRFSSNEFPIRVESHRSHYRRLGDDNGAFLRAKFARPEFGFDP